MSLIVLKTSRVKNAIAQSLACSSCFLQLQTHSNVNIKQGGIWQQKWLQNFRRARICYFRNKCAVFARDCKFVNLIQCNVQYRPYKSAFIAIETLFLAPKKRFLPKVFQKVRKSRK